MLRLFGIVGVAPYAVAIGFLIVIFTFALKWRAISTARWLAEHGRKGDLGDFAKVLQALRRWWPNR